MVITGVDATCFPTADSVYLSWELDPGSQVQDIHRWLFHVDRSESPGGPWDDLTPAGMEDRYNFIDSAVDISYPTRVYHYRIRAVDKETGDESLSAVFTPGPDDLDPVAREIRFREAVYLQKIVGRRVVLLPRRTFGTRCGCYDPVLGKRLRSHCQVCYDTTYLGGYLQPMLIWVQFNPSPKHLQFLQNMVLAPEQATAWTLHAPRIKINDVLVEEDSTRWRVASIPQVTTRLRVPVHQEMLLTRIPPGDIEYDVPAGVDIDDNPEFINTELLHIRHS